MQRGMGNVIGSGFAGSKVGLRMVGGSKAQGAEA